jgi:hypothetical protein
MKGQQAAEARNHKTRPVDGIIVAGVAGGTPAKGRAARGAKRWIQDTWVLTASPEESLAEFFLEDFDAPTSWTGAHKPVVCRGITPDGTLILDNIQLSSDRFLSEIFSTEAGK